MLVLRNKHSYKSFLVDNLNSKIFAVSSGQFNFLLKMKHVFGNMEILKFKDIDTINKFRKVLAKDKALPTISYQDTYTYTTSTYPEYLI
jgi:hypothetical protein